MPKTDTITEEKIMTEEEKILIVDDISENLFAMKQMLNPLNVTIRTAQSGNEALSLMLRETFSVILLDVQMPQMDGFETALLMQSNEKTKHVPIIFVTAVSKEQIFVFKGYEVGGVDYLLKPVDPEILTCKVQVFIQMHREKIKLKKEMEARKKAQIELVEAKRRLEQFLEAVPLGITVMDKDGSPVYSNRELLSLLEINEFKTHVNDFSDTFNAYIAETETKYPADKLPMLKALAGKKSFISDMEIRGKRKKRFFEVWSSPIYDDDSNIVSSITAFIDFTERKLLEIQLRQAQKMEAIGRLAGGVAHDLNNMLMVVSGYAQLLRRAIPEASEIQEPVAEILKASQRASSVTHQLLAFSRRQILKPSILNINAVVTEVEKMLKRIIGEDIQFITSLDPQLPNIKVDPNQLHQVLLNLAINSRDAMPTGGKLVINTLVKEIKKENINLDSDITPGTFVELSVSDTGTGMDKQTLSQIFEPFYTTKGSGKGTGLGLATVYGIVKQSKGFISVYSELGKGSTFRILFPIVSSGNLPSAKTKNETYDITGTETLLLVEDENAVRELIKKHLVLNGYKVISKNNPLEALQFIKENNTQIHLLITDVIMPHMNGRQLVEKMSSIRKGFKVLYISGYDENIIAHHGILNEKVELMLKPFNLDDLMLKVRKLLDDK